MKDFEISPELQIEINRRLLIQAWRENGHRKCKHAYSKSDGTVCSIGLALEMFEKDMVDAMFKNCVVITDNDSGKTFSQIADAAEQGRYWD